MCTIINYNPINAIDSPFAFASIILPLLSIGFASALGRAGSGFFIFILQILITLSAIVAGIILIVYAIRRIYNRTGSWKFAVASYFVEIVVVYLGVVSLGIFMLGSYYLVDRMLKK